MSFPLACTMIFMCRREGRRVQAFRSGQYFLGAVLYLEKGWVIIVEIEGWMVNIKEWGILHSIGSAVIYFEENYKWLTTQLQWRTLFSLSEIIGPCV